MRIQMISTIIHLLTSCHFAKFAHIFEDNEPGNISTELFLYKLIIDKCVQDTCPNVAIALRMYLVLMVTNCSAARSFSKLKQIENRLRTSMTPGRQSISSYHEHRVTHSVIISDFAVAQSRNVSGL